MKMLKITKIENTIITEKMIGTTKIVTIITAEKMCIMALMSKAILAIVNILSATIMTGTERKNIKITGNMKTVTQIMVRNK